MSDDRIHLADRLQVIAVENGFIVMPQSSEGFRSFDCGSVHVARNAEQLAEILSAWANRRSEQEK